MLVKLKNVFPKYICLSYLSFRRRKRLVSVLVVLWVTFLLTNQVINYLMHSSIDQDLQHLKRSTDLMHYLDNIKLLIEPSTIPCGDNAPTPLLVMVASAPSHYEQRQLIRQTWGQHLFTFFVLGMQDTDDHTMVKTTMDENAVDCYMEASEYNDIIGYDFRDHYQNLTLKSVLMLQWSAARCPRVQFLFKTDDDVLLNPWRLDNVLDDHYNSDAALIGFMFNNTFLHREEGHKWYIPRWMNVPDPVPRYLCGAGYFIRGKHIKQILYAAKLVPLINIEDIYITYLVSNAKINLDLAHDSRLNPYTPLISYIFQSLNFDKTLIHNDYYKSSHRTYNFWEEIKKRHQENDTDFVSWVRVE